MNDESTLNEPTGNRSVKRVAITQPPFVELSAGREWHERGFWPARWITVAEDADPPVVSAYRRTLALRNRLHCRLHVTADARYELFLDGELVGRGPAFGDPDHWCFDTYDLDLDPGEHRLVAKVWSLGDLAPYAQMSLRHGFLCAAEGESADLLSTGIAPWESQRVAGVTVRDPRPAFGTGGNFVIDGRLYPWGIEAGEGDGWSASTNLHAGTVGSLRNNIEPSHLLRPNPLPPMLHQLIRGGRIRSVGPCRSADPSDAAPLEENAEEAASRSQPPCGIGDWHIPAHSGKRLLLDLEEYVCAYHELTMRGGAGAVVSVQWAESLWEDAQGTAKGHRDRVDGLYFHGVGDVIHPAGGDRPIWFRPAWWQSGRYVLLSVATADEPVVIESLRFFETRYPLQQQTRFDCDDAQLESVLPLARRALQTCAHETFIDCPYYEQMMYCGDTRLAALASRALSRDDRLVEHSLDLFRLSRMPNGLVQARYPCRVKQTITPFALFWIGAIYDHARWRGAGSFIETQMPTARGVMDAVLGLRGAAGLIDELPGWHFIDWVPAWRDGEPRGWERGPHAIVHLQALWTLRLLAELEAWQGEPELADRWSRKFEQWRSRIVEAFWDEGRGLFADDLNHQYFSQHAQCFAVLSDAVPPGAEARLGAALAGDTDLARTTLAYSHYLFEACRKLDRPDVFHDRLRDWTGLVERGFRTTPEQPEPTRSDCHGWSAHVIHHALATVLGVRPASIGFEQVEVRPWLGAMTRAAGRVVHPRGWIDVELRRSGDDIGGRIVLPEGVRGTWQFAATQQPLHPGVNEIASGNTAPRVSAEST